MAFRVGDVVTVAKASGVNAAGALGLVIEVYAIRGRRDGQPYDRPGWTILFADGRFDGFSPDDCALFDVRFVEHNGVLALYHFRSATYLDRDYRAGLFTAAFPQ